MEAWLCRSCLSGMESIEPPFCKICGEAFDGAAEGLLRCSNCADRRLHFEFAIAAFKAEGVMRTLVHKFKYNKDITLRAVLVAALHHVLTDARLETLNLAEWTLVPVPLHRSRLHERGFNQSWELCRLLGRRLKLPTRQALKRSRPTHKQADLTRAQRLENLSGAFRMSGWTRTQRRALEGKNVLLVDDVFTTGATTDACARVLRREGGVARVIVISVARG